MNLIETLNTKTVAELRKLAARFDVTGRSTMKKAELVRELTYSDIADVVELAVSLDETAAIEADADTDVNEVSIVRHAPGRALGSVQLTGGTKRDAWIKRAGGKWVLTDSYDAEPVRVTASTLQKLGKLWAKKLGFRADVIDVVRSF